MNRAQTIRIIALLLLIFVAGVWTGRFTAPKTEYIVMGPRGQIQLVETALARMKAKIPLSAEQEVRIRAILEEMESAVAGLPPLSNERMEVFRSFTPRFKAELKPEQQETFDRHVKDVERRFENNQRRRGLK